LAGSEDTYDVEFRLLHKDGHYLPVLSRGFILRDETGKALRVCGANTDIAERKVAEDALRLTASVFAYAREGITVTDMLGNILDVNAAFSRITGYGREDALGQNPRFLQSGKQDKAFYIAMWRDLISQGYWEGEIWNRRKSGEVYPERLAIASVRDDQGNTQQYVAMFSDISERKRIEFELLESAQKFRLIAENTSDGITIFDKNRTIQYVSPSVMKQLGYSEQEELGRSNADVYALLHPDGRDELFQKLNHAIANKLQAMMYSYRIKHKTGHYIWREDSANFRYSIDGEYDGAYVVSRDITERKRLEDEVRQLAYFDPLTQLPNRRMLSDRLGQSIAGSNRSGLHAAVMVLDLDNFKPLNDQHGHLVGDLLLVEVARRLLACVREVDTVARFGGDEFVVVLNDLDEDQAESRRRVQAVAEKIRLALEVPYLLSFKNGSLPPITIEHHCSASIGVALFFNHEAAQSEILKWADAAMYQAKEAGRNSVRFYEKPENAYGVGKCQQSNSAPNYWNPS
jgi:diguanylate cyclase (GGDEF)-like protein/PAS domain S-box-containing protein